MSKHGKPDPQPPGKQAEPKTQKPSGRIAFDARGKAIWEWRTDSGGFKSDVDTQEVKALQDLSGDFLSIQEDQPSKPANFDPYSSGSRPEAPSRKNVPPPEEKKPQRRTLDDMRRLSEEIKRQRAQKMPT